MAIEHIELDTFAKWLLHHSRQRAEHPALREKRRGIWRTTTWGDLADEAAAMAAALADRGLQRGAHLALVGDHRPRLHAAMCAAHGLGAIVLPLYQDATAEEMAPAIQRAQATHAFAENQEQVDKLLEILPRCPSLRCIVYDEDRGMRHYQQPQLVSCAELLKQGRALVASKGDFLATEAARGSGPDAAFLIFTSGTTGPAKGVVLTHASLIDRARAAASTEQLNDTDTTMAYLPLGWIGQNFVSYAQPMVVGYCVCCPESSETLLTDMREMGPTYLLAPPRALKAMLTQVSMRLEGASALNQRLYRHCMAVAQRVGARLLAGEPVSMGDRLAYAVCDRLILGPLRDVLGMSRLRVAYTAGDAIDTDLLMFFRALGINLKQLYGSTETGFFVALQRDGHVKPETVGQAAQGVELKLTPQGEILVRSAGLFKEYHLDPQTTALAKNSDGWFHTGDAGHLGADGHLRIIDRLENVGALNDGSLVAPSGLESKLKGLPSIREAVALGQGRNSVCVLIDIDTAAVGQWADQRSLSYTGHADLASLDEVQGLIAGCIAKINGELAQDPSLAASQIHRFAILRKELDADDGVLTRTGKLRRDVIAQRYQPLIEAIYAGRSSAHVDGGDGVEAEIRIHDAKVFTPAQLARAA